MHKIFRELLKDAEGISEFVVVINLDIRNFSAFSREVDSRECAVFIKKVYMKLIDEYFIDASYFKPTGDGLLIIIPYTEDNLREVATKSIDTCLRVLKDFGTFCINDPMVNFRVPQRVGIGLSRGTACRIISENQTLDYSGKVLNLASRLMDIARPSGIVFDADFGIELLSNEQIELFTNDEIYIRGIAERERIGIWYTKDTTVISPVSKQPLMKEDWEIDGEVLTLRQIKERPETFHYLLSSHPVDSSMIKIKAIYPGIVKGKKREDFIQWVDFGDFQYMEEAGQPKVAINFGVLANELGSCGVKSNWLVTIQIIYSKR